jgi:hypothetical protein
VFSHDGATHAWSHVTRLRPSDTNDWDSFGTAVELADDALFVGAPFRDTTANIGAGVVHVFRAGAGPLGLNWSEPTRVSSPDATHNQAFGHTLAYDAGLLICTAYGDDVAGQVDSGSAYAFGILGSDCNQNARCDFCDIQSGAPDTNTNGVVDTCEIVQFCFCTAPLGPCGNHSSSGGCLNSNGTGAAMTWACSTSAGADNLALLTSGMPAGKSSIMFMSTNFSPAPTPFFDGRKCLASPTLRWPLTMSNAFGSVSYGPNLSSQSLVRFGPSGHLAAGTTWGFQTWFRDPTGPCGDLTNLSSAVRATFTP